MSISTFSECITGAARSASDLVDKLIYSKRNRLIFAFVLTFVTLTLMTLTDRYGGGSDDDWAISLALSGRLPDSGLCLFVNAAISQITLALNTAFPAQNWFLVIEFIITATAFFSIVYGSLTYMKPLFGFLLIGTVEAFVLPGCTYESNFTFVAGIASLAGFLLLVGSTKTNSHSVIIPVAGIIFCVLGFLWRAEVLLLSIPFFAVALGFIFLSRQNRKSSISTSFSLSSVAQASIPYIAVIVLCGCFYAYNQVAWQEPEWAAWKDFNSPRSELSDYPMPDYEKVANDLTNHGLSKDDYFAPLMWITADTEVYTTETMEYLSSLSSALTFDNYLANVSEYLSNVSKSMPSHIILVVAFAIITILASRKKTALPQILVSLGFALVICLYFAAIGRLPERVETFIWLYSLSAIFLSIKHNAYDNDPNGTRKKLTEPYKTREVLASTTGLLTWVVATLLVLILTVPKFNPALLSAYLNQDTFKPNDPATEYASRDDGKILVWGTASYFDVEHAYRLKFLPSEDFLSKNLFLGGWTDRAPYTMANRERVNMTNVIRGLAENPDAYLIIEEHREGHLPSLILSLIQERYYPNATIEKVESFKGKGPKDTFSVWKVRI